MFWQPLLSRAIPSLGGLKCQHSNGNQCRMNYHNTRTGYRAKIEVKNATRFQAPRFIWVEQGKFVPRLQAISVQDVLISAPLNSNTSVSLFPFPFRPLTCALRALTMSANGSARDQKGDAYFRDWSRRMDPTKRSWYKRGELFYPESD